MKNKMRLVVSRACNRNCKGCVNTTIDWSRVPYTYDFTGWREIIITGGEPLLDPEKVFDLCRKIREVNPTAKIILYTAAVESAWTLAILALSIEGITLTLHTQTDVDLFATLNSILQRYYIPPRWEGGCHLRLKLVEGLTLPIDASYYDMWHVETIKWKKECPLPEGEVLRQLKGYRKEGLF